MNIMWTVGVAAAVATYFVVGFALSVMALSLFDVRIRSTLSVWTIGIIWIVGFSSAMVAGIAHVCHKLPLVAL